MRPLVVRRALTVALALAGVALALSGVAFAGGCADSDVDVMLTEVGDRPIAVIKEVRAANGLGLQEAKLLVDGVPSAIVEDVPREEGERIERRLERAGATAELE